MRTTTLHRLVKGKWVPAIPWETATFRVWLENGVWYAETT